MLIIIMQIRRRQWLTSSLGTLNMLQELCLLAICVAEERERKKATQFEFLEKKSFSLLNKKLDLSQNPQLNVV
jgi:hypothetical protein